MSAYAVGCEQGLADKCVEKIQHGIVPVEEDGSASFTIPSNTPISIQPLDEKGRALQLMRSWLVAMPGESLSCTGCHELLKEIPGHGDVRAAGESSCMACHGIRYANILPAWQTEMLFHWIHDPLPP